ncbi:MAG: LysR family transcriptional regulator [Candidatus Limiplasma sp.]|nr:LysR family transcriptional regulator [Candidatus Limiplasma sp.]
MTIRHLRIFVAVCREASITNAAEKMYMTQPAVSLAIKELEENYGVKLFDRLTRRIQITQDGKRLLEYALHMVGLFDEMEQAMRNPDAAGELKIGSSLTIGACLLPAYTQRLTRRHPNITPKVVVDNSDSIIKAVAEGRIDLGLVEGSVSDESLCARAFMEDALVAVCARQHPFAQRDAVSMDEFLAEPLLLREHGSGGRELFESMVTLLGKQANPLWESVSTTALIRAVEAGNGVAVLPQRLVGEYIQAGRIRKAPLEGPMLSRWFYLIYHKKKYLSESIRSFVDIVMEDAAQGRE